MSLNITELNGKQQKAVMLILQGKNDSEVAEEIGITRETVNRWRNQDDEFIVTLNSTRQQIWESFYDRLRGLVPPAIDVLEQDIRENSSVRSSIVILRMVGLYGTIPLPEGPKTLEELKQRRKMSDLIESIRFR